MSAALALVASALWGVSDFLGGTWSRRCAAYAVVGVSELFAMVLLVGYVVVAGRVDDPPGYLPWAIGAGITGLLGISAFYVALATGTMGVVAPIAAIGVVVPVTVGLARGESPTLLQFLGAGVTVLGVVLASGPEVRGGAKGARPIVLAFVAAAGFGAAMTCIAEGSNDSVPMTLLVMRVVTVIVLGALALRMRSLGGVGRVDLPALFILGVLDVVANAAYAVATQSGLVSLTSVLASLYPAVTVLLARGVHGERMRRIQDLGVGVTLFGVVLMASGGGTG